MEKTMKNKIINIWTIAAKDIRDAIRNKLVLSIILGALVMLVIPKGLAAMIAPPENEVLVYDLSGAGVVEKLQASGRFDVVIVKSEDDLIRAVLGTDNSGLVIPEDFQQDIDSGDLPVVEGYITWGRRDKIPTLQSRYKTFLEEALGNPVEVKFDDHLLFPDSGSFSMLGISFLTMLVVLMMVGVNMVPYLIFEEKQTKTLDALLVSPATETQLVIAKAMVGLFYTGVVSAVLFGLNWNSVVHWELAVIFVTVCGLFTVSIGLVVGSFFERQQDVTGLLSAILLIFIGGPFVVLVDLGLPRWVETIFNWIPTSQLFHLLQKIFYESYAWSELLPGLLSIAGITILLYAVVAWKLRRSDR